MKKIICLLICAALFSLAACSSSAPSGNNTSNGTSNENGEGEISQVIDQETNQVLEDYEPEKIESVYKLSEKIDLSALVLDEDLENNPWGYNLYFVIPSWLLEMEALDSVEQITNIVFDSKGNYEITTTENHDFVLYTDTQGQEELKNSYENNFIQVITELNRSDLGFHIEYNSDFTEFAITGSEEAIQNLPESYVSSLMRLGAFYQIIQGKSAEEIDVAVSVYYYL